MGFTVHVQKQARKGKKKIGYWKLSVNYIILLWSEDIQSKYKVPYKFYYIYFNFENWFIYL